MPSGRYRLLSVFKPLQRATKYTLGGTNGTQTWDTKHP